MVNIRVFFSIFSSGRFSFRLKTLSFEGESRGRALSIPGTVFTGDTDLYDKKLAAAPELNIFLRIEKGERSQRGIDIDSKGIIDVLLVRLVILAGVRLDG